MNYSWGIGGHNQKHGGAILPDMMRLGVARPPVSTDVNDMVERSFQGAAKEEGTVGGGK